MRLGAARRPLSGATLRGDSLSLSFEDERGIARVLRVTVDGATLTGTLAGAAAALRVQGRALGPLRAGAWSRSPPLCDKWRAR